jgi:AAA ATPase-like protein
VFVPVRGGDSTLHRGSGDGLTHGCIPEFPLGTRDLSNRLLIPEKLYGRTREIDTLLAAFDRVVSRGTTELVLVSGYSGVGKSSIVKHRKSPIAAVALGKAETDIPAHLWDVVRLGLLLHTDDRIRLPTTAFRKRPTR